MKQHEGAQGGERVPEMTGLRALAVGMVVLHHAVKYSPNASLPVNAQVRHILMDLAHGVDLFFVISGFCLAYPLFVALKRNGVALLDLPRYAAHRIARILPPYYAAVILCSAMFLLVVHLGLPQTTAFTATSGWDILREFAFLDRGMQFVNGSFWSLAVEWRWYAAFPLLLAMFVRSRLLFAVIATTLVVLYHETRVNAIDVAILPAFMLGILSAWMSIERHPFARYSFMTTIVLVVSAIASDPTGPTLYFQDKVPWQLAMFSLVVAATSIPMLQRVFRAPLFTLVGTASYSIYLIHEPIIAIAETSLAVPWWLATSIAIAAGILFWAACERLTQGAMKQRLTHWIEPYVAEIFTTLNIPLALRIGGDSTASNVAKAAA